MIPLLCVEVASAQIAFTNSAIESASPADTNSIADRLAELQQRVAANLHVSSEVSLVAIQADTNGAGGIRAQTPIPQSRTTQPLPEEITLSGSTAEARFGPHIATFEADSSSAEPMKLLMPGGGRLRSRVFGCAISIRTREKAC